MGIAKARERKCPGLLKSIIVCIFSAGKPPDDTFYKKMMLCVWSTLLSGYFEQIEKAGETPNELPALW